MSKFNALGISVVMRDADMPDDLLANLLTGAHRLDDLDAGALAFGIMFGADEHVRECSRTSRNRNHQLPLGALLCPPGSQGLKLHKKHPTSRQNLRTQVIGATYRGLAKPRYPVNRADLSATNR